MTKKKSKSYSEKKQKIKKNSKGDRQLAVNKLKKIQIDHNAKPFDNLFIEVDAKDQTAKAHGDENQLYRYKNTAEHKIPEKIIPWYNDPIMDKNDEKQINELKTKDKKRTYVYPVIKHQFKYFEGVKHSGRHVMPSEYLEIRTNSDIYFNSKISDLEQNTKEEIQYFVDELERKYKHLFVKVMEYRAIKSTDVMQVDIQKIKLIPMKGMNYIYF